MSFGLRLLLIEDNELFRGLLRQALAGREVVLEEAGSLAAGLEALSRGSFDCAVVDLHLPDGDGMAVLGPEPQLPIVFLTGSAEEATAIEAIRAGAEDYLIKTSLGDDLGGNLLLAVRKAIERFGRRRELLTSRRELASALEVVHWEHRQLERQIEESIALFNLAPLGYLTLDRAGRVLDANDAACAMLGYHRQLLLSMPMVACLSQDSVSLFLRHLWKVFTAQTQEDLLVALRPGRRQASTVQLSFRAVSASSVRVAMSDATRVVGLREALTAGQVAARAVRDQVEEAVLEVDRAGLIRSSNDAVLRLFGGRPGDLIDRELERLLPGFELVEGRAEWSAQRLDGSLFHAELVVTRLVGLEARWIVVVRDLSAAWRVLGDLLDVAEAERRRLGQELHDNLGQRLAAMGFVASSLALRLKGNQEAPGKMARRLAELCQQTTSEARSLSQGLFPAELERHGLVSALRRLGEDLAQIYEVRCKLELEECSVPPGAPSVHLYRIIQEALHNGIKHGGARKLVVRLGALQGQIALSIEDDGRGMSEPGGDSARLGLISMRHHCQMLGGTLELAANYPSGMIVRCLFPHLAARTG